MDFMDWLRGDASPPPPAPAPGDVTRAGIGHNNPPAVATMPKRPDNFDACVTIILTHEGGYVNNPNDRGGATNHGITEATLENWLRKTGQPCNITAADVQAMPQATAKAIYRAEYWPAFYLPPGIDLCVFDADVMSGMSVGAKFLQGALGVTQDGQVGPGTLAALAKASVLDVIHGIAAQREAFYRGLVANRAEDGVFLAGWLNRVAETTKQAQAMAAG